MDDTARCDRFAVGCAYSNIHTTAHLDGDAYSYTTPHGHTQAAAARAACNTSQQEHLAPQPGSFGAEWSTGNRHRNRSAGYPSRHHHAATINPYPKFVGANRQFIVELRAASGDVCMFSLLQLLSAVKEEETTYNGLLDRQPAICTRLADDTVSTIAQSLRLRKPESTRGGNSI